MIRGRRATPAVGEARVLSDIFKGKSCSMFLGVFRNRVIVWLHVTDMVHTCDTRMVELGSRFGEGGQCVYHAEYLQRGITGALIRNIKRLVRASNQETCVQSGLLRGRLQAGILLAISVSPSTAPGHRLHT